jgi:hypothetical protein
MKSWKDNTKMSSKQIWCEETAGIHLSQDKVQLRTLVDTKTSHTRQLSAYAQLRSSKATTRTTTNISECSKTEVVQIKQLVEDRT